MGLPASQLPEAATRVSPEDYLRLESESEYKHEIFERPGSSDGRGRARAQRD